MKSRPIYPGLTWAPAAARHLMVAEGEGAGALVDLFAEAPEGAAGRSEILYTAGASAGSDPTSRLSALGARVVHGFPTVETLLFRLTSDLSRADMGLRLYVAGSESFLGRVVALAQTHGIDPLSVIGEPGKMPMRPGVQTADVFGALFATYATLASLVGAARHGEGRIADVSLVEASIAAAAWEAAEYLETGNVPQPMGNRHRLTAPYQLFETKDKRYVAIGTPNDMLFGKLMQTLKLEHLITDPRFTTYAKRKANEDDLVPYVEPAVREWIAADIEAELMKQGVPCACVNNFKEVFEHPQIVARNVVQEVEHPRLGRMKVTRNPILMDHDGPDLSRPSPMLGEHSEEILRDLGYSADDIQKLAASGVTKLAAPVRKMTAAE